MFSQLRKTFFQLSRPTQGAVVCLLLLALLVPGCYLLTRPSINNPSKLLPPPAVQTFPNPLN
jgi:hypothetical protein